MIAMQAGLNEKLGAPVFPANHIVEEEWKRHTYSLQLEEFAFIMDVRDFQLKKEAHTDRFFGMQLRDILSLLRRIHPDVLDAYIHWGKAAYDLTYSSQIDSQMAQRKISYRILIPLLFQSTPRTPPNERPYYWVIQTVKPYQLDENKQLVLQHNSYRIIKKFEEGDLATFKAEICHDDGLVTLEETNSLLQHLYKNLLEELGEEAANILNAYLEGCKTADEVAATLGYSINRVNTIQKTILKNANEWYPWQVFTMAKQFAQFLAKTMLQDRC